MDFKVCEAAPQNIIVFYLAFPHPPVPSVLFPRPDQFPILYAPSSLHPQKKASARLGEKERHFLLTPLIISELKERSRDGGMQRREGYWDQIGVDWGVIWVPRKKLWASKFFHITPQYSCTQQEIYYIRGLSFYSRNKIEMEQNICFRI